MNWRHLLFVLFGASGRINRAKWWLGFLVAVLFQVVWAALVLFITIPRGFIFWMLTTGIAQATTVFVLLRAGAKRLHDLDRSANWMIVLAPFVFPILWCFSSILGTITLAPASTSEIWLVYYVSPAILVCMLIWLGCTPGTPRPNRYGPDPLGRTPTEPAVEAKGQLPTCPSV
jgi:uncharacterized membrane protein YhaH (DUF805 family)